MRERLGLRPAVRWIVLALVASVSVAAASPAVAGPGPSDAAPISFESTILEGKGCETSVGLSMIGPHFNDGVVMRLWGDKVGPFKPKDVKDYSGVRAVGIVGMVMVGAPGSGPSTGVWHAMSRCDVYTTAAGSEGRDFGMGWISAYIEPPEWGRDGIQHHFFVVDQSFSDKPLVEAVLKATSFGLELNPALEADIGWPAPGLMHGRLHDANHGLFEWQTAQGPPLPRASETIRLWLLVHESDAVPDTHFGLNTHGFRDGRVTKENENRGNGEVEGRYYPIVFDVTHTARPGASIVRYPLESTGTFSHTEYCHHGHPEVNEEGGHAHATNCRDSPSKFGGSADTLWTETGQTEAGLYWAGYDTTIKLGPDYRDHWFDVTWVH